MSLDHIIDRWTEVRAGFIDELAQIPADQFDFRPTPDARSVAEIVRHILEAQRFMVGETCRPDTNFKRQPILELIKSYAGDVAAAEGKDALIDLMKESMKSAEAALRSFGEEAMQRMMERLDGMVMPKTDFVHFTISHEMYHRGQITVYQRLLGMEPVLTARLREFLAAQPR
ncbi:MAG TPA: DinB family protein [Blastocatellia bacterium]|nr:DinB family protein [Blastocatellia bacterium]